MMNRMAALLIGSMAVMGCGAGEDVGALATCDDPVALPTGLAGEIELPACTDWIDRGEILSRGAKGEWDHYLYGGFTGTVVRKDGMFFLYYQGARDYSERYGTVTYRAIGVATSSDGIRFTKHEHNPAVAWFPHDGHEEGAVSGGAALDDAGNVVLVYGANTQVNDRLVTADGRIAMSPDGFRFSDQGLALDHTNESIWGHGDELFPIISIRDRGRSYVYYIPNGTMQRGRLGVAWGQGGRLRSSVRASADGKSVEAWGMGSAVKIGAETYALFLNDVRKGRMEVRTVHLDRPDSLSTPLRTYAFDDFSQGAVYLDGEMSSWYLFHRTRDAEAYRVKVAPVRTRQP